MTDRATNHRKHIAAIVINSVSHDSRVLKEADGLAAAGYRVTIYGIQDNRCNEATTARPSGVVIRRAEWRSGAVAMRVRMLRLAAVGCVLLAIGSLTLILLGLADEPFVGIVLTLASIPVLLFAARRIRRAAWSAANAGERKRMAASTVEPKPAAAPAAAPVAAPAKSTPAAAAPKGRVGEFLAKLRKRYAHWLRERAIAELVLADRPDAVHAHDLQAVPVGWRVKRAIGCPLVFDSHELHDDLSLISERERRRSRRQQTYYSSRLDGFVTVNDSIAATMRERYPALPKAVVVRNATRFDGATVVDDGRLHAAAGLPTSTRILLYQGGFAKHRGLDVLVRSAAKLPAGWVLVMMGWGNFEAELRRIAQEVDPEGHRIRFLPGAPQEELARWTAGGALGVIPYENVCLNHWFCTPNKIWEYPVAGVPILASPFPELGRAVSENGIGVLLEDPVTPENIAAVVASVTDGQLATMRANCRRFLERDNWSIYERRLVELYAGILGSAQRSPDPQAPRAARESDVAVMSDR